jgi:imidazolonepropionase-like amidohydrolase
MQQAALLAGPGFAAGAAVSQTFSASGPSGERLTIPISQAGVRITAGTDGAGLGRLLPGFGLHHEIGLLREAGLSPFVSLRAATVSAAQALNLADQIGSMEVGKTADLSVWTADPLTTHLRPADLGMVVLGGVVHRPGTLANVADTSADQRV